MHTRIAGGCLYHASVALGKPIKTKARIREISDSGLLIIRIYQNDLKSSIAFAGSAALKTAVPATHTSTPASDACSMVSLPIPPSASIRILFRPLR